MNESPFQKHQEEVFSRELTAFEKFTKLASVQANQTFMAIIPNEDIKQMPRGYVLLFGGLLLAILAGSFAGLFYQGYSSNRNQKFLAPLQDSTSASPYCELIPVANTGTFLATQTGIWEGQNNFIYSEAAYAVSLTNYQTNYSNYQFIMDELYQNLAYIGNISVHQDLAENLLYWYSYSGTASLDDKVNRFFLVGDPTVVFNRQEIVATFTSVAGECNASSIAVFNPSKGALIAQFSINGFLDDIICLEAAIPFAFGYLPNTNADTFYVELDVRSLVTCMTVNFGIMGFDTLIEIPSFRGLYYYNGKEYNTSSYYDPKFPGMTPLTCITTEGYYQCIIRASPYLYALPIYNHLGNSTLYPELCNCSKMSDYDKQDSYNPCNLFRFIVGFLYYPTNSPDPLFALALKYNQDVAEINRLAFNASFTASYWGRNSPYYENQFNQPNARNASFEFCKVNGMVCKMMVFSVFDTFQVDWAISSYYYQLLQGACQNTIATPYSSFQKLIQQPYAPLVQPYQQCQKSPQQVFFTELGIQIGNMSAVTPASIALVFLIIYLCRRYLGINIPMGYRTMEKSDALDAFAVSLLLARDRREAHRRKHLHLHGPRNHQENEEDVEKQEQQAKVLLDLVEALEADSELQSNVYRLKNEIVRQRLVSVNWREAHEAAKRRLHKIAKAVPSLSMEMSPMHGNNNKRSSTEEAKSSSDSNRDSFASMLTSSTVSHAIVRPGVTILNKGRSDHHAASSSSSTWSSEHTVKELTRLGVEFATLLHQMISNTDPPPAVERDLQQRYWLLVAETVDVRRLQLQSLRQKELELLIELVELHAACSLNCSVELVRMNYEERVAYVFDGVSAGAEQMVVTLSELREIMRTGCIELDDIH